MRQADDFRWNETNREHATAHGCSIAEIEHLLLNIPHGFPRRIDRHKRLVIGRGQGGRMIRVIYLLDPPPDAAYYVIHAMPLTTRRRR